MEKISVVIPSFNEEKNIPQITAALNSAFQKIQYEQEYIFVDDGSTDKTWDTIVTLAKKNPNVHGITLSRNFGKERAILAGVRAVKTKAAIVMDADLQHPPEVVLEIIEKWKETNCDIVHAIKTERANSNESLSDSILIRLFYSLYKLGTGTSLKGASDFKLLNQRAIEEYSKLSERDLFFRGLVPWLGFHQETVTYKVAKRFHGTGKWSLFKRITTAIFAITSFSVLPLQLVTFIGCLFLLGAILLGGFTFYDWWTGAAVEGFTTVILLLLIVGATLMISLGIIGQYIARIYDEVKGRPTYIIKEEV